MLKGNEEEAPLTLMPKNGKLARIFISPSGFRFVFEVIF